MILEKRNTKRIGKVKWDVVGKIERLNYLRSIIQKNGGFEEDMKQD